MEKLQYQHACRRNAASCLRLNHQVRTVDNTLTIATRRTIVARKPHQISPSGIGRKTVDALCVIEIKHNFLVNIRVNASIQLKY
jgi:hypothetical protein